MMPIALCLLIGQSSIIFLSNPFFILIVLSAFFLLLILVWRKDRTIIFYTLILFGFVVAGRLLESHALNKTASLFKSDVSYLCDGWLRDDPILLKGGWRLNVTLEACGETIAGEMKLAKGHVQLFAPVERQPDPSNDELKPLKKSSHGVIASPSTEFILSGVEGLRVNSAKQSTEIAAAPSGPRNDFFRGFESQIIETLVTGDRVRFLAKFREPREFKNPGSFNYSQYLLTQGIDDVGALIGPKWIVKVGERHLSWPLKIVARVRHKIDNAISTTAMRSPSPRPSPTRGEGVINNPSPLPVLSSVEGMGEASPERSRRGEGGGDAVGILKAIIIGKVNQISQNTRDAFSHTGVAHLLAISGLHVGYVALIIFFVVRLLIGWWPRVSLRWPLPRFCAMASLPVVWFYVAIAGYPVSAIRAAIMLTILLIALMSLWRRDLLSALATAAFVILIVSPASLFSVSFQLSVASVFAIIILAPIMISCIDGFFANVEFRGKWMVRFLFQIIAVTLAATVGSAPLVALHFHFISAIGLFANIVAVPFTGVILMPLAMAAAFFSLFFTPAGAILWKGAAIASALLLNFISYLDRYGESFVFSFAPSLTEVVLAYAVIAVIVFWKHLNYRRLVSCVLAAFCLFDIGYWHIGPLMGKHLEVTFLDVGHGDSTVVRFPNNHVILIDGGGIKGSDFDIGKQVVAPALLRMGIHHVDSLILTHPHHDHYKGLAAIAEQFGPKTLYTNGVNAPEEELSDWQEFLTRVEKSRVSILPLQESLNTNPVFSMEEGGARLEILAPRAREVALLDDNDTSLVIKLSYGRRSFLLTGDLMRVGESMLIDRNQNLEADVLKVGHHGSETSSSLEFLKAVKPSIAVITVGEHNQYGVPDQIVLNGLRDVGANIYRTDIDGAITIRTDGESIDVDTFVKNPKH